ncbi:hypothetical protein [Roseomonas genomospecies 6]|uniref:hypothetical protein n=1 Tax=Roseomonas genomospecies 6 TaxID=214106 RepID=UPI0011F13941|nr:hypothetical protein [Roseomonas genomospecies 6]
MWKRFKEEIKSPYNAVFGAVGLISFLFAIYTWYSTLQRSEISYRVEQVQLMDVSRVENNKQGAEEPFSILDSNGNNIKENIYGANISVWNSGDTDLGRDKIRKPLTFLFSNSVRIIDASITFTTDDNISEFYINKTVNIDNIIYIGWKYFDPKSGFRLRIIYTSPDQAQLSAGGSILGVKSIYDSSNGISGANLIKSYKGIFSFFMVFVLFCSLSGSTENFIGGIFRYRKMKMESGHVRRSEKISSLVILAFNFVWWVSSVGICILIISPIIMFESKPPF